MGTDNMILFRWRFKRLYNIISTHYLVMYILHHMMIIRCVRHQTLNACTVHFRVTNSSVRGGEVIESRPGCWVFGVSLVGRISHRLLSESDVPRSEIKSRTFRLCTTESSHSCRMASASDEFATRSSLQKQSTKYLQQDDLSDKKTCMVTV